VTQLIRAWQDGLGLRRRLTVTVSLPADQVRHHLKAALSKPITLTGRFHMTRHYWGQVSNNHLTLHGPRAHQQLCFFTQGALRDGGTQTELALQIHLRDLDFYQLAMAVGVLFTLLMLLMQGWGVAVFPLFSGFLYGMTQWHFSHYAQEITQLLTDLMMGKAAKS
jgi:hypothetical protein